METGLCLLFGFQIGILLSILPGSQVSKVMGKHMDLTTISIYLWKLIKYRTFNDEMHWLKLRYQEGGGISLISSIFINFSTFYGGNYYFGGHFECLSGAILYI